MTEGPPTGKWNGENEIVNTVAYELHCSDTCKSSMKRKKLLCFTYKRLGKFVSNLYMYDTNKICSYISERANVNGDPSRLQETYICNVILHVSPIALHISGETCQ